jgi:predicted DsbA family dithiol-disulfide isomerase
MRVDIWSDIACPWCFLGKHRFDAALARTGLTAEVVFRAFQLDPHAPRAYEDGSTHTQRIAKKFGTSAAQIDVLHTRMRAMGESDGIEFHFDRVCGGNTFDAHRVVRLGLAHGNQAQVKESMLRAYFSDGEAIGDPGTLVRVGAEAGLPRDEVHALLAGDRFAAEVRADERTAADMGITGVPFFVIDNRIAVGGAQPVEVLVQALSAATRRA